MDKPVTSPGHGVAKLRFAGCGPGMEVESRAMHAATSDCTFLLRRPELSRLPHRAYESRMVFENYISHTRSCQQPRCPSHTIATRLELTRCTKAVGRWCIVVRARRLAQACLYGNFITPLVSDADRWSKTGGVRMGYYLYRDPTLFSGPISERKRSIPGIPMIARRRVQQTDFLTTHLWTPANHCSYSLIRPLNCLSLCLSEGYSEYVFTSCWSSYCG